MSQNCPHRTGIFVLMQIALIFCVSAICEPECYNGGKCISPGVCSCPVGFKGNLCKSGTNYCLLVVYLPFLDFKACLQTFIKQITGRKRSVAENKHNVNHHAMQPFRSDHITDRISLDTQRSFSLLKSQQFRSIL